MVNVLGVALATIGALGVAGQSTFVRLGTDEGRSNDALFFVLLINMVLIAPLAVALSYPDFNLTAVSIVAFVCAGTVATMLGRVFLFAGIQRIGASRADSIKASMPLFATIVAVLVLGETLTPQHLVGIVLVVAGVGLVSLESSRSSLLPDRAPLSLLLLPLTAAFLFGFEPVFAKIGFAEGTPYLVGLAIKTVAAAVTFSAYLAWRGQLPTADRLGDNLRWYVAAGVVGSIAMVCYYAALNRAPVVIVVPIIQSSPLFVAVISYGFLQRLERVTPRLVASAMVVVVGAILVSLAS